MSLLRLASAFRIEGAGHSLARWSALSLLLLVFWRAPLASAQPAATTLGALTTAYDGTPQLAWSYSGVTGFTSYKIYRDTAPGVSQTSTLVSTLSNRSTTSFNDTTAKPQVAPGATFYYSVAVVATNGTTLSNERSITLINAPPAPVTLGTPTANTQNGPVYLSWSQSNENDFVSYKVYRGTSPGVTPTNGTLLTTSTYRDSESNTDGYTDTTATYAVSPGASYYYIVVVTDSAGQTSISNEKSITLTNLPPVAVTLNAPSVATYQPSGPVSLSWTQSGEFDFASYSLYRGTTAGVTPANGTLVKTITSKYTTSYIDTGVAFSVAPGTTYYYVVVVTDSAGQVAPSNEKSITLINQPPAAVTLSAPTIGANNPNGPVYLSWTQSGEYDFASYKVYRATSPNVTPQNSTLLSTSTYRDSESDTDGYTDTTATYSVAPGATYYYIVVVTDSAGQTSVSNEKSITLTNLPPVAVTLNAPTANTQNGPIQLSWSQSNEFDFASYKVYRRTSPGVTPQNGTLLATITTRDSESNTDSYLDKAVSFSPAPGTSYYYIVVVTDSAGQTSISNEKSITLTNLPPVAVTLNNPVAGAYPDSPGVSLNWTQSNEFDFASYKVYRGTAPGVTAANGTLLATITTRDSESNTDGYTDTTATYTAPPGTTYYYVVVVVDSAGQTSTSNEKSVVLVDAPPIAVTLAVPVPHRTGVALSWSQNTEHDFAAYRIYRSTVPGITPQNGTLVTRIMAAGTLTYKDVDVPLSPPPGVVYYYCVFVEDKSGQLTGSNEANCTAVITPLSGVTLNPVQELSSNHSTKSIRLTWTQSTVDEFASYAIYRSTSPGVTTGATLVQTITSQTTTSFDTSVGATPDPGITYYFRVFVQDTTGAQAGSNEQSYTALGTSSMNTGYQFNGKGNWSLDAVGSNNTPVGNLRAIVPPGSTVEKAFLYSSFIIDAGGSPPTVNLDGTTYSGSQWKALGNNDDNLQAYRTDVTAQVKSKIGAGSLTPFQFPVLSESPNEDIDGEVLAIVYSNPGETERTIALLEGYSDSNGNTTRVNLSQPLGDPTASGFEALMSLGIGYSYRPADQYSQVDIDGRRLTTSAGGQDDGQSYNGGLITVGGIGDSPDNPADPFHTEYDTFRYDDELYNLAQGNSVNPAPFLTAGDKFIQVDTLNKSHDDNIFFIGINITARAGVNQKPPEPGTR